MDTRIETRRSDRWQAEAPSAGGIGWIVAGAALVLTGYGLAATVVAAARGSVSLPDEVGVGLAAATPVASALGAVLALVGTRRSSLPVIAWVVFALGALLVLVSIAAIAWVLLALRSLS